MRKRKQEYPSIKRFTNKDILENWMQNLHAPVVVICLNDTL